MRWPQDFEGKHGGWQLLPWLRRAFAQDDFAGDWYGWLTNQISHIALGVLLSLVVSVAWFFLLGEFPVKQIGWALVTGLYVALEVVRGWAGRDSFEDTVFACGYGSGGAFLVFTEYRIGQPALTLNVTDVLPILAIACAHLIAGSILRT